MEEVKIDKRTKAYKDRVKLEGESMPAGNDIPVDNVVFDEVGLQNPPESPENPPDKPDFSKAEVNPGFKLCMNCGCVLEYNDDGLPKRRVQPELCNACVWRKNK